MKTKSKMNLNKWLTLALVMAPFIVQAVPYTFTSGTVISASEVNANFSSLKGLTAYFPSDVTLTCSGSASSFPTDFDDPDLLTEAGAAFDSYTIPSDGVYQILGEFPTNTGYVSLRITINGTDEYFTNLKNRRFVAGDIVKMYFGCDTKHGASIDILSAQGFLVIKRL